MTTSILVTNSTQRIIVNPATQAVSVILAGPVGPAGPSGSIGPVGPVGPTGPSGSAAASFEYTQLIASNSWVINHGLGFKPNVSVFDVSGATIDASLIFHTDNQVEVQFLTPRAGTARLS
jgi:hypothetical protein